MNRARVSKHKQKSRFGVELFFFYLLLAILRTHGFYINGNRFLTGLSYIRFFIIWWIFVQVANFEI